MKRIVYLISLMIVCIVFMTITSEQVNAQTFDDVTPKEHYYEAVEFLAQQKIISSNSKKFNPNSNITRGQFAKILATALQLDIKNVKNPKFTDVSTKHEFYPYIAALANKKIISGYPDGSFGVNKLVKKTHLSKFLVEGFNLPIRAQYKQPAQDVAEKLETNKYISTLYFYNIEKGTAIKYNPNSNAKRYVVAKYIYNIIQNEKMIKNQKAVKYPVKMNSTRQQFFSFSSIANTGKFDYLTNSFVILPTVSERGFYLPMDKNSDPKIQFEVNEEGKVTHLSAVDKIEPQFKLFRSIAVSNDVQQMKIENILKEDSSPVYGEPFKIESKYYTEDVIGIKDVFAAFGQDLYSDVFKILVKEFDGTEKVTYFEIDEYDFEIILSPLEPITTSYFERVRSMDLNKPFEVTGPRTYTVIKEPIYKDGLLVQEAGIEFEGIGKYKVTQNGKTYMSVQIKEINGQLFGKSLYGETVDSTVMTYDKLR